MEFDLSRARLHPSRRAGALALLALAGAVSAAAPAQARVEVVGASPAQPRLEGVQTPDEVNRQIERERAALPANAASAAFRNSLNGGRISPIERLNLAQGEIRSSVNQEWAAAINAAFFRPGVGTCFRGQADGLVSGQGAEARGMSREGRELAERSSVQILAHFRDAQGNNRATLTGTGTVVRARDGGANRILTAAHVADPTTMNERNGHNFGGANTVRPGERLVLEIWTTDADGTRTMLGTASPRAVGEAKLDLTKGAPENDWAVLDVQPASRRHAATLDRLGLDVATDLSPTPFVADMGTRYAVSGQGDLPRPEAIPGRVPTQGMGTGQSGSAFLMADADGIPRIHGILSARMNPHDATADHARYAQNIPVSVQRGAFSEMGGQPVHSATRNNAGWFQPVPEQALAALGVEGMAVHTRNARARVGAQGFVAGYQAGHCVVSAGVTVSADAGISPGVRLSLSPEHPIHANGATWVPDGRGGFSARIAPGQGALPVRAQDRPSAPDPQALAAFARPGVEMDMSLSARNPELSGRFSAALQRAAEAERQLLSGVQMLGIQPGARR